RFLGENLGAYDVKPSPQPTERKSVPMVPMGGVRPAKANGAKTLPAIPLGGMKPAQPARPAERQEPKTLPAIPMGGMKPAKPAQADGPKSIPAIPMSGPKPAKPNDRKTKSVPMIPMGGPSPAKAQGVPAVPMVSMGTPTPKRPETPEEVAADVRARLTHQLRGMSARRYGALLASGRLAEAEAVAMALLMYADDDAARAALIGCAIRAGCMDLRRASHLDWLDTVARGAGQ
ncbi:MAG: hypothetical protein P1V35_18070, partial [Planctomycetota bacterium]|nr:hypothetical protein [Planctomycetota bacterium]